VDRDLQALKVRHFAVAEPADGSHNQTDLKERRNAMTVEQQVREHGAGWLTKPQADALHVVPKKPKG
jgi:hypothetical protein